MLAVAAPTTIPLGWVPVSLPLTPMGEVFQQEPRALGGTGEAAPPAARSRSSSPRGKACLGCSLWHGVAHCSAHGSAGLWAPPKRSNAPTARVTPSTEPAMGAPAPSPSPARIPSGHREQRPRGQRRDGAAPPAADPAVIARGCDRDPGPDPHRCRCRCRSGPSLPWRRRAPRPAPGAGARGAAAPAWRERR